MTSISRRKFILVSLGTALGTGLGTNLGCGATNTRNLQESGDFLAQVNWLKKQAISKDSNLYVPPKNNDLRKFRFLATALINRQISDANRLANELDYELVKFTDTPTQQIFYGLREKKGKIRGWGSYFLNTSYQCNALIEVPHPLFDQFSEEIGAKAFLKSKAFGFLLAGAHRNANGTGTADVCHLASSIFQEVHKVWARESETWQIHGFDVSGQLNFPPNTQVVLSNGQGGAVSEILGLIQRLNNAGFQAYLYNKFPSPGMKQINRGVNGAKFSHLGGTTNVQGIYCSHLNKRFIHVELEQSIRANSLQREQVSKIISESIYGNT